MPCQGPTIERTVKDLDWVGWNRMEELVDQAEKTIFEHGNEQEKRLRAKGLILIGFKTGGRISEILPLTKDKFSFKGKFWTVTLPLVKRYDKIKGGVTKWKCEKCGNRWKEKPTNIINGSAEEWRLKCRKGGHHEITDYEGYEAETKTDKDRTIEIDSTEPLSQEFKQYVQNCDDLIFPHPTKEGEVMKRSYAYTLVNTVDSDIWLHWLRAQRACQLADELDLTLEDRMEWFEWEDDEYARLYGSRKYEIRDKMENPKRRIR